MKHLLPLFCLTLAACGSKKDDPVTPQARLLGTWKLQTERTQTTYTSGNQASADKTYNFTNTTISFTADGKFAFTYGTTTNDGTYTFDGKTLTTVYPGFVPSTVEVAELTATKFVRVTTETNSSYVRVVTTTAAR